MGGWYYGHYTAAPKEPDLPKKVREELALTMLRQWPKPPTLADMTSQRVAGVEALYIRLDTPRPGGLWRQWSFVLDGHAFVIVSAMPKEREAAIAPQVDQMVGSFKLSLPATRPAQ